jgi:beta-lactamase class A
MKTFALIVGVLMLCHLPSNAAGLAPDTRLQSILDGVVTETMAQFSSNKLGSNQLAVTFIDLRDKKGNLASFRGDVAIYPASVVKLFYLAAAHQWMADGKLEESPELRRAMQDMIVDSYNEATHYVLDVLTQTTSGPELPEAEMKNWGEKRNAVNRYFAGLGYRNINVNQKTWCEGPYGRERLWVGETYTNRNALTTDATALLLADIAAGTFVSTNACAEMMKLLARDRAANTNSIDNQTHGYTAIGLPRDARLWSKAGWTSTARHDAAYVELADGRRFVLVTFTTGQARNRNIIGTVARKIVQSRW